MKSKTKKPTKAGKTKRLVCDGLVRRSGADLIRAERIRQTVVEGWTAAHDNDHAIGELACAASCYALPPEQREQDLEGWRSPRYWPWEDDSWKPTPGDRIRELVKAGALVAAEIDRLLRLKTNADPFASDNPHNAPHLDA